MSRLLYLFGSLAFLVLAGTDGAAAVLLAQDLPASVMGEWKVVAVLINQSTQRTLGYDRDDRRLVGRSLSVDGQAIKTNLPEGRRCEAPKALTWQPSADELIGNTMAAQGYPSETPTSDDYNFPLSADQHAEVLTVICTNGHFGPYPLDGAKPVSGDKATDDQRGTWIAILPKGRISVRWYDECILIMARR